MANMKYSFVGETTRKIEGKLIHLSPFAYEDYTHTHGFTELFFVISGKGKFIVNSKSFDVETGDSLLVAPNVHHTEVASNLEPLKCMFIGIDNFSIKYSDKDNLYLLLNYDNSDHIVSDIVHMIMNEVTEKIDNYKEACNHLLGMLQIYIKRKGTNNVCEYHHTKKNNSCYIAKKYIEINYGEKITLDVLADISYTNKYYLAHTFANKYGIAPMNYLQKIRIERSKKYLENTEYTLTEISQNVGFGSQSYFSQIFKKHMGCTPSEYREEHM